MVFSIILFAMIGAMLKAATAYWVVYAIMCTLQALKIACQVIKAIVFHN